MAGESGVVHFDVNLEVLVETMCFQEADHGFGVYIVLMFGGFHRLWLDQECTGETFGAGIVAGHGQHGCQMFLFALLVGIEQAHVAFAASPEHIVLSAKCNCSVDSVLYLHGGTCHNVEIGVGGCSVHVACMAEYIGGAPEILYACLSHLFFKIGYYGFHVCLIFLDR